MSDTKYNFNLEWDELPEDFREEKIDECLTKQYEELGDEEKAENPLAEYLENQDERVEVENRIKRHFPIYF